MGTAQSTRKITLVNDDKAGVIKLSESLAYRLRGQIEGQQAEADALGSATAAEPHVASVAPPVTSISQVPGAPKVPVVTPIDSELINQKPLIRESAAPESLVSEPVAPESLVPEPPVVAPAVTEATPEIDAYPSAKTITVSPSLSLPIGFKEVSPKAPPASSQSPVVEDFVPPDVGGKVKTSPAPSFSQPSGNIAPWSLYAEEAHLMVMRLREEKEEEIKKLGLEWRAKMESREKEFTKMARISEEEVTAALKDVEKLFVNASCTPVCQNQQEAVMSCYQDHPRQSLRCAREVENFSQCVDLSRLQSLMKQRAS
ncbi:uncharacterized protein Chchd3 [Procambarus clarkii]|uniref:uncharacterized protein Chchd3 n=1 Tax=Procambarus clarkii TaxID=6728 RepID=UPI0037445674